MKVSSFKQFLEEEDSKAIVQTGINSKGIDNNVTKEIINSRLALVTNHEFLTPYIALGSISRVLAYANIIVPQYTFLDRHEGEVVFDATQFGKMFGVNTDGTKVPSESGHFVYFSYVMNDDGYYDCFAALVDQDELDDILDIEGEDEEDVDKIGVDQKVNEDWTDAAVEFGKDITPILGTQRAYGRFQQARQQGDVAGMIGHGADAALSAVGDAALAIPIAGAAGKAAATGIRGLGRLGVAGVKSAIGALGKKEAGEQLGRQAIVQADRTAATQAARTAEVAKAAETAADASKTVKATDTAADASKTTQVAGRAAGRAAGRVVKSILRKVRPGLPNLSTPQKTTDWVSSAVRKDSNIQSEESLNELSPATLSSYMKGVVSQATKQGGYKSSRAGGMETASKKLNRPHLVNVPAFDPPTATSTLDAQMGLASITPEKLSGAAKKRTAKKFMEPSPNRIAGRQSNQPALLGLRPIKSQQKPVDEKPLNELSPSLLKRYREARQARMDVPAAGKPPGSIPDKNILRNRERSLELAADKLSGDAKVPAEYTVISKLKTGIRKLKRGAKKIKQWDDKLGKLDVIPKTTNYADSPARDSGQASQAFLQQQRQSQAPSIQDRPSVQQALRRGAGIGISGYPASALINSYDPTLNEEMHPRQKIPNGAFVKVTNSRDSNRHEVVGFEPGEHPAQDTYYTVTHLREPGSRTKFTRSPPKKYDNPGIPDLPGIPRAAAQIHKLNPSNTTNEEHLHEKMDWEEKQGTSIPHLDQPTLKAHKDAADWHTERYKAAMKYGNTREELFHRRRMDHHNGMVHTMERQGFREEVESIDERKSSDPKGLAYKVTAASHAANPEWGPPDHTQDPQTHFGTAATRSSTLAAIKAIRGIKKFDVNNPEHVEAVSRAIHGSPSDYEGNARGWSQTAMTHPAQTDAQRERRAKLTGPYDNLSEPEKEKDRQIARTVATNIKKK